MQNIFHFVVLLLLCNTCFGQSPFVQANNSNATSNRRLDTIQVDFTPSSEDTKNLSIPTNNYYLTINLSDTINAQKKAAENYERKGDVIKNLEQLSQRKELKQDTSLLNVIASLKKDLETSKKESERLIKSQSTIENNYFDLANQKIIIQLSEFNYRIVKADTIINTLNNKMEKVEENTIKLRTWRLDKVLQKSDDTELLDLYTKMVREIDKGKNIIEDMQSDIKAIKEKVKEYEKIKDKINVIVEIGGSLLLKDTITKLIENQNKLQQDIINKFSALEKKISSNEKLKHVQDEINNIQNSIAKIYKSYKTIEGPKDDNVKAIVGITQPLSEQGQLVPNISVLGYKEVKGENSHRSAQLKLFTAPSTGEKTLFNNAYRLLIPEASSYGFLADFSFGFIPSDNSFKADKDIGQPVKKLGLNFSAYYLGKTLAKEDSSTFNTGMLHFKIGMQYVVIGRVLSIYSNINPFYLTNGVTDFQDTYTSYENKLRSFVDFGLNAYLNLSPEAKQNDFFIDLDIGFIAVGGDIKSIVATTDPLIPRIKITLVKGFRF
ncbi:MAG: hypothetical protein ACKVU0_09985 [Saprospiraceae bacterium]